ncbi:lysophospholipid acyltransferase family protein [Paenibacillus pasadenensis]|uniref:lysophospholipid acyltransferase family protein n=1 Tax=Paenibacillus pasadenensis TaxID=217090 RepID=UPI00203FBEE0|nr:lysophospholipid acyltransferase family protein [Paenibacillus pasadenensis]MCM3747735.1 lysophospholipid acyltransferase family protein [Paenibacillus pasadenensis]
MIPAAKSRLFRHIFALYQSVYLFPRYLHGVYLSGELDAAADVAEGANSAHFDPVVQNIPSSAPVQRKQRLPVLYAANHVSWWDGLVLFQLTERLTRSDPYILMDERGLRQYPFFRRLGAFSVNRERPRDVLAALTYAEQRLRSGCPVWIFPQGAITPPELSVEAQNGIGQLLCRLGAAEVRPVTLHYVLGDHQKPAATVKAGRPLTLDWSGLSRAEAASLVADRLQNQAEEHRRELAEHPLPDKGGSFRLVLSGGRSTSDRYRSWKERWGR